MASAIPKKSSSALSIVKASKPCADKRVLATLDSGYISRSHLDREADWGQMGKLLRLSMCNSKSNKRSSRSLQARRLTRPMIQSQNLREESLSKRISWVRTRDLWRIRETLPYLMDKSSQMLGSLLDPIWRIHSMVVAIKIPKPSLNSSHSVNRLALIISRWIALCQVTWRPHCTIRYLRGTEALSTAMTLIWLL